MKTEAEDIRVIEVETHLKDGQVKCPKCGATGYLDEYQDGETAL